MFANIIIDRFRGIHHAEIVGFKRVNLFFGPNNCGKSSLLESIFLLSGQSVPQNSLKVNRFRYYDPVEESDLSLLFYNLDSSSPIHFMTRNGEKRELNISLIRKEEQILDLDSSLNGMSSNHESQNQYGLRYDFSRDNQSFHSSIVFSGQDDKLESKAVVDPDYHESVVATFLPSKYEYSVIVDMLSDIIEEKNEESIFEALRIFDPRVVDFVIYNKNVWVDIGLERRIPINMMGDGMRRVLAIVAALIDSKDGILLVDEIDNGLNYRVFKSFWRVVFLLAKEYNVQVFATTHNIDNMQGFSDALELMKTEEIYQECMGFSLSHKTPNDELEGLPITPEQFAYALEKRLELR